MGYLFKPFGKILQTYFSKKAGKGLPDFANQKFISDFFIPLATPTPNTFVELGRFHLDDGESLKENMIYGTNKLGGEALDVLKDEKFVGEAEGTVIDGEYKAARILSNMFDLEEKKFDDFLNTRVIFGCSKTADNIEFGEGCIVPLNEDILEPVKIIKNNKVIGYGEIVIPDENFCVKVTKVIQN